MNMLTNYKNVIVKEEDDTCGHLKVGERAFNTVVESDTLAPSTESYHECEACYNSRMVELTNCPCCSRQIEVGDLREWRWYGFYAPQGDEPITLCVKCWDEPTHQRRIQRSREDMEWEQEY